MKTIIAAVIAATALSSVAVSANAAPHRRHVQVCHIVRHHRVCHWVWR